MSMGFLPKNSQTAIRYLEATLPSKTPRYERKFRIPMGLEKVLIARLMSLGFQRSFPDRKVFSTYYDTYCLDFAQENINGVANRLKIRKRWYGMNSEKVQRPVLEFKQKKGFLGYKYSHRLIDYHNETIIKHIQATMGICIAPVVETSYERSYFMNTNGFRATIDVQLGSKDLKNTAKWVPLNYVVMEIKYPFDKDEEYREYLHMKILSLIPLRLNKSSKYVEGLTALGII